MKKQCVNHDFILKFLIKFIYVIILVIEIYQTKIFPQIIVQSLIFVYFISHHLPSINLQHIQIQQPEQMREKHSKDDFQISNKNRIKIQKKERNGPLRSNKPPPKSLVESPENSDDDEYQQKLLNRGSEWWAKVDHRFFRHVPTDELQQLMQRTSSDELLELRHPSPQLRDYFTQRITTKNPYLGSPCFLRALFRRQVKLQREERYELVTYAFKEYEYLREPVGRIMDRTLHLSSFRYPKFERAEIEGLGRLQLDIIDVEDCQQEIRKLLQFDVVNSQVVEQMQREITLWERQLEKANTDNVKNWREMFTRMSKCSKTYQGFNSFEEQEIAEIKKELRMTEVLLYFKRGHSDKTQRMLEDAMEVSMIKELSLKEEQRKKRGTKLQKMQCLFETDCKICFCTESDDRNKVIYCDACNTSFHQACYGVETIEQSQNFFCQVCSYVKAHSLPPEKDVNGNTLPAKTVKKPSCLLCCKPHFPMRQFNGHFYHVTCLVLFDLVQIKDYRIEFRQGLNPTAILHRIVQNQICSNHCAFCHKDTGMKFPCKQNCGQFFHPICAYLNGVHFDLVRSYRRLNVALSCPSHHPQRDTLNQVYLRRFFSDYKGTSNKTDAEFQIEYSKEMQEKNTSLQQKLKQAAQGVMRKGKISKSYKCSQPKPRPEAILKRQGSEVRSNPSLNPVPSGDDLTQTRRLLKMMSGGK